MMMTTVKMEIMIMMKSNLRNDDVMHLIINE